MEKKKKMAENQKKSDKLWRKPITLDSFETEDPLETLYKGREVGNEKKKREDLPKKAETITKTTKTTAKKIKPSKKAVSSKTPKKSSVRKTTKAVREIKTKISKKTAGSIKITEEELKDLLRIKSDSFQFTDIREILRGRSLDIYAYLRHLAGESGVCKITHNNLMKATGISRPTLFKQGSWLETLHLIEKHSVPGDHTGTSYTVRHLEDAFAVPERLIEQMDSQIKVFRQK